MKKTLLVVIAIVAMAGISTAQKCSNGCSAYDSDGTANICLPGYVDCLNDNNNCGSVGAACGAGSECHSGVCECLDPDVCGNGGGGGGFGPLQQSKPNRKPFTLMNKHDDVAVAILAIR